MDAQSNNVGISENLFEGKVINYVYSILWVTDLKKKKGNSNFSSVHPLKYCV